MQELLSVAQMERTRVARFKNLVPFKVAHIDAVLPQYQRENLKVLGPGVSERSDQVSPIDGDHEFSMTIVKMPPGGGVAPHAHPTSEVFMPLNGTLKVVWGWDDVSRFNEIMIGPWDTISVPLHVMRAFSNPGSETLYVLAIVGGKTSRVTWHPDVIEQSAKLGVVRVDGELRLPEGFEKTKAFERGGTKE